MQANDCFICGGNDFTVIDGAFVCNECGIQSQAIREEQITFCENINIAKHDDMIDKDHEITRGSQLEKVKKLLSWESFNLILLGLTNEIIELGAKPSLKVIVLQLWVRYLQCIEAAFISKKFKKLPKLPTAINNIDCQILYGIENIKTKILYAKTGIKRENQKVKRRSNKRKLLKSNNSSATSFMTPSHKRYRITRKLRKVDNSTRDLNNDSVALSNDVSLLQRNIKSSKIKVKLMKNIKKSLKSMPSKTENLNNEELSMLFESGAKCWFKLRREEKKNALSITKIISIIRLALMINNDDIHLSDMIRWIHEGHFHVNRVNLFLPENVVHGINFCHIIYNSSRNGLNIQLAMILNHLEVRQLPDVDFKKLAIRFCNELQLPEDFTHFVCKLLLISPPNIEFTRIVLPDVEVKVMAYILFAAKFLFCLDGNAENLSSDFAEKINALNKVGKKLFNWNNYVQYIECRNSIISQYNYLLHKSVYGNNIRNTQTFINDWNIMTSSTPLKCEKLNKDFRENTELLFKSLSDTGRNKSYREIPASTKPLSTTLKWIFEYYSNQLSVEAKIILKNNFTETDVSYLTDEKRIYDLAKEYDVPIEVNYNRPLHYMKQQNKEPRTKRSKIYTSQTTVYLNDKPRNKEEHDECLNNSYGKEKPNTIFLGTGLNYWFIHMNIVFLRKFNVTKMNAIFKQKVPSSFLWFMNLCCRILNCPSSEVYLELIILEKKLSTFLKTNEETASQIECKDMLDTFSSITL